MDLSRTGRDDQTYWDAIEIEVEVELCRKTGNLTGYLVGAFSRRLVLLITEWLVLLVLFVSARDAMPVRQVNANERSALGFGVPDTRILDHNVFNLGRWQTN